MLTTLMLVVAATTGATAQTFTTLHTFNSTDGSDPEGGLVQATNGSLYGTTSRGGASGQYGTVFKITPGGTLTTVHSFDYPHGSTPYAGLVQATNGNLYGTTYYGGTNGDGTVFKITLTGTLTTLRSFDYTDGDTPYAGLVQATNGSLYGTTEKGGAHTYGTVFKITPSGKLTTLHSFDNTEDHPDGGLIQATDGNLYGTTRGGPGTVFKITPGGKLTTLLSFSGTDENLPYAGLVQATDGNLYGTTSQGGTNGSGTVFKITPSGTLTTLHSFDGTDGRDPEGALVQATDGNLYGTTYSGGTAGSWGTIFQITPSGTLMTLHNFDSTDGASPVAGLVQATDGNLYGTTMGGGPPPGYGTIFRLSVGLGPFVETQTTSGKVGAAVKILGTNLTGATSVTFNGMAAVFKVASASLIKTTVPTGATTGTVEVTTPKGTLKSNLAFRVTQ